MPTIATALRMMAAGAEAETGVGGPYSLAGMTYSGRSFDLSSQESSIQAIAFNLSGSKMYAVGNVTNTVYEYDFSVEFNIETANTLRDIFLFLIRKVLLLR